MMPTTPIQEGLAELLFDTARENGDAAGRYAALILAYGQAQITAQQAAQATMEIALGETRRGMELAWEISAGWSRWWASLWQVGLPSATGLPSAPSRPLPAPLVAANPLLMALDRS
jgi:hypothetical protein